MKNRNPKCQISYGSTSETCFDAAQAPKYVSEGQVIELCYQVYMSDNGVQCISRTAVIKNNHIQTFECQLS